jgi:hypothetical protein
MVFEVRLVYMGQGTVSVTTVTVELYVLELLSASEKVREIVVEGATSAISFRLRTNL